jgi:hypothetical protein
MAELVLVYGGTGSFKTAQLLFFAKYLYKLTGKRSRLASCDGGGWKPLEGAVKAGLIEAWGVSSLENPRSILRKLSQGYWPYPATVNGATKLVLADDRDSMRSNIGVLALEGLTSVANVIMRDALNKQMIVAGDQRGEKGAIKFDEKIETLVNGKPLTVEERYSFATQGNYNDAQRAVYDFVSNLRSLPIPYVYLSALEARGEEEDTGKTILGPAVIGKAVTAQVGSWVGDQIHAEDYFVDEPDPTHVVTAQEKQAGVKQRMRQLTKARYWFIRHPDPRTGMLFPAKPRVAPEMIPKLLEIFPGGYFVPTPTSGIDAYLEAVDTLQEAAAGSVADFMKACDKAREAASRVEGTDAPKADPALIKATIAKPILEVASIKTMSGMTTK